MHDSVFDAVRFEVISNSLWRVWSVSILALHCRFHTMQRIGSEIGAKVCSMSEDGALLHEPARCEKLLSRQYIGPGKNRVTARTDKAIRDRRVLVIDGIRKIAHNSEAH